MRTQIAYQLLVEVDHKRTVVQPQMGILRFEFISGNFGILEVRQRRRRSPYLSDDILNNLPNVLVHVDFIQLALQLIPPLDRGILLHCLSRELNPWKRIQQRRLAFEHPLLVEYPRHIAFEGKGKRQVLPWFDHVFLMVAEEALV